MKNLLNYLLIILLTISSCKKEEEVIDTPINTFSPTIMTSIRGIVLDKNGDTISGVNVSLEGNLVATSSKGLFSYNNINNIYILFSTRLCWPGHERGPYCCCIRYCICNFCCAVWNYLLSFKKIFKKEKV